MHMNDLAVKLTKQNRGKGKVVFGEKPCQIKMVIWKQLYIWKVILWKECIKCLFSLGMVSSLA